MSSIFEINGCSVINALKIPSGGDTYVVMFTRPLEHCPDFCDYGTAIWKSGKDDWFSFVRTAVCYDDYEECFADFLKRAKIKTPNGGTR